MRKDSSPLSLSFDFLNNPIQKSLGGQQGRNFMAGSWSPLQPRAPSQFPHMWFGYPHDVGLAHSYPWMESVARRLKSTKQECVRWQMFLSLSNVPFPSLERRAAPSWRELSLEAGEPSLPNCGQHSWSLARLSLRECILHIAA